MIMRHQCEDMIAASGVTHTIEFVNLWFWGYLPYCMNCCTCR
jgi:hypothetical protein